MISHNMQRWFEADLPSVYLQVALEAESQAEFEARITPQNQLLDLEDSGSEASL